VEDQSDADQLGERIRSQSESLRQLTEALGSKQEERRQLQSTIAEDDAAVAEEEKAVSYYKRAAAAQVLLSALEQTIERQSSEMIQPITGLLSDTWKQLWGQGTALTVGDRRTRTGGGH
jgi:predicted  nucleic acid-binding Zn-ribbon protein